MELKFPSGVEFDALNIYNDILIIDLPNTGKLSIEDVAYLGTFADALGLSGLNISVGSFSTFVPTTALREFLRSDKEKRAMKKFISKWHGFQWLENA